MFAMPNYRCQYYLYMVKYLSTRFTARTIYWVRTTFRLKLNAREICSVQCLPAIIRSENTLFVILQKNPPIISLKMYNYRVFIRNFEQIFIKIQNHNIYEEEMYQKFYFMMKHVSSPICFLICLILE